MKINKTSKLALSTETVRVLTANELGAAQGGFTNVSCPGSPGGGDSNRMPGDVNGQGGNGNGW